MVVHQCQHGSTHTKNCANKLFINISTYSHRAQAHSSHKWYVTQVRRSSTYTQLRYKFSEDPSKGEQLHHTHADITMTIRVNWSGFYYGTIPVSLAWSLHSMINPLYQGNSVVSSLWSPHDPYFQGNLLSIDRFSLIKEYNGFRLTYDIEMRLFRHVCS
jgi:hypothetical protein